MEEVVDVVDDVVVVAADAVVGVVEVVDIVAGDVVVDWVAKM